MRERTEMHQTYPIHKDVNVNVNVNVDVDVDGAAALARGVCRSLADLGYSALAEFSLKNSRRADVAGLDTKGGFIIVEIKTSPADFHAGQAQ